MFIDVAPDAFDCDEVVELIGDMYDTARSESNRGVYIEQALIVFNDDLRINCVEAQQEVTMDVRSKTTPAASV